jgi:hypothetical protein
LVCFQSAALPHTAAAGVIFSGQNFCVAQSRNCETKITRVLPARKTGGDSGELKWLYKRSHPDLLLNRLSFKLLNQQ